LVTRIIFGDEYRSHQYPSLHTNFCLKQVCCCLIRITPQRRKAFMTVSFYDAVQTGKELLTFRESMLPPSSESWLLDSKMRMLRSSETSANI
jgi:hypothetical protein